MSNKSAGQCDKTVFLLRNLHTCFGISGEGLASCTPVCAPHDLMTSALTAVGTLLDTKDLFRLKPGKPRCLEC